MRTNLTILLLALATAAPLCAQAPSEATTLVIVRHAEKVTDDGTRNPPLTVEGQARAARLAYLLHDAGIDAVLSTDFRRTHDTGAPLADALGLPVTTYEEQGEALAGRLLRDHAGQQVLVVGHSNTVPRLLNALVGEARYEDLEEATEYDALFIVTVPAEGEPVVTLLRF